MTPGLIVFVFGIGLAIGWTLKTMWLEQYVKVRRAPNGHWLVFFGGRIVGRATDESRALLRKSQLIHALRGTKSPK